MKSRVLESIRGGYGVILSSFSKGLGHEIFLRPMILNMNVRNDVGFGHF